MTSVDAVEPSDLGWELSAARRDAAQLPIARVGLDGQRLEAEDASYDAVLSTFTLCTIPDAARALAEVRRVLRPGGDPALPRARPLPRPLRRPLAAPAGPGAAPGRRWVPPEPRHPGAGPARPAWRSIDLTASYLPGPAVGRPWSYVVGGPRRRFSTMSDNSQRAIAAAEALGLTHTVTRHGPVRSLAEAAAARGVEPRQIVKTMVVRVSDDDHRFVLVPGDREIAWPKLRALLGVNRISMPSAETAYDVTGYVRGTITPLGQPTALPVVADASIVGPISIGGGAHGVALTVDAAELARSARRHRRRRHRARA